jgi:hypothetical protein
MYGTCKQCCNKKLVSKTVEETKQVTWNQWISVKESRTFKTGGERNHTGEEGTESRNYMYSCK